MHFIYQSELTILDCISRDESFSFFMTTANLTPDLLNFDHPIMKSERLKKLELELKDLDKWLKLDLVPKKDLDKHQREIDLVTKKIEEEKERLRLLKENGSDEYAMPKRTPQSRQSYQEPQTIPGVEVEGESGLTDANLDLETETYDTEASTSAETATGEVTTTQEEEEDPFSDKNRWRRGVLEDPESDSW